MREKASFKTISQQLTETFGSSLPSILISADEAYEMAERVDKKLRSNNVTNYGIRVHSAYEYPERLRDADWPMELLYYEGWWDLVFSPAVSVVGTRKLSPKGIKRTEALVRQLVADNYTIVSGLALGADTIAHKTALQENGRTIAVLGTPLSKPYPRKNTKLLEEIAREHLVISQVPVMHFYDRYNKGDNRYTSHFFPARNVTMSALSDATIIVEASDTSGTMHQARAALKQGRKLIILDNCFRDRSLTWPEKFEKKGAIRARSYDDVREALGK